MPTPIVSLFLLVFLLICGCGQVEYPSKLSPDQAVTQDISQYDLSFPVMKFWEGKFTEYVISGAAPSGSPVISIEGLPKGV